MAEVANNQLWEKVSQTNTKFLKDSQKGLSSIDGYYVFQKATEQFGPCGLGWGYQILEEDYRQGGPIFNQNKTEIVAHEIDHMLRVKLWFKHGDEKGELEHYGVTRYVYSSKYGPITDEEAPKKSLTDAIKKCLSMLGFCADVYLGMFEDADYKQGALIRSQLENDEKQAEAAIDAEEELNNYCKTQLEALRLINNPTSRLTTVKRIKQKIKTMCLAAGVSAQKYEAVLDKRITEQEEELKNAS